MSPYTIGTHNLPKRVLQKIRNSEVTIETIEMSSIQKSYPTSAYLWFRVLSDEMKLRAATFNLRA